MKVIRESARALKKLHLNTTELFNRKLKVADIQAGDGKVQVEFIHHANEKWGSRFKIELTRAELQLLLDKADA